MQSINQSNFIYIAPFIQTSVVQSADWQANNKTEQVTKLKINKWMINNNNNNKVFKRNILNKISKNK